MLAATETRIEDMPCVILAGGQSRRFGSNKAFAPLHGMRMIDVLIKRIELQTKGPIAINAAAGTGFDALGYTVLSDPLPGQLGPLVGLLAAMIWAKGNGYNAVVTTPVDTPILPADFIQRLVASGAPSIAACQNRLHAVHGLWPVHLSEPLKDAIDRGVRAARAWAIECQATACEFHEQSDLDPFFNVNTRDDMQRLQAAQPVSPR